MVARKDKSVPGRWTVAKQVRSVQRREVVIEKITTQVSTAGVGRWSRVDASSPSEADYSSKFCARTTRSRGRY